ncbi:SDR family oxidoreductase [Achromobacter sp. GG226]|uniref:SDR family NAD(P)-dependent oxidoreductase n=1 Tax=Verticiella alkaliphila TaxID=2779529 RepID=UPI001C0DA947|nr:SDR family NAD(P)-dependent oxidoreductase [Verticiella sp. GG226]MBU4610868.1 SDR family oxidoreductase [Verticiella sp. GG226]
MSHNNTIDLSGQSAIVTGSGRGLGLAFAQALARAGAGVVINDVDAEAAQQAVDSITAEGGRAVAEVVAVGSADAADRLVARAVETYGRLDLMCTNAGVLRDRVLWNMSDEEFDLVTQTHLRGTFTCARAAVRQMRAQGHGGRIVLVSSISGQRGKFGQGNYAAAKGGIAAMARTWATECARAGITVNAIVPVAMTQMVATIPVFAPFAKGVARGEPLPPSLRQGLGLGMPEDVAPLLLFLASSQAAHITGQCIGIGGDKLSLWSQPTEVRVAYRDGGWDAESIARTWAQGVGQQLEPFGDDIKLPE